MGNNADSSNSCTNTKPYPFWIEQKWQEIIGWFMLGLVLLMSCIGHFIAYLKKRARQKHRDEQKKKNKGGPLPPTGIGGGGGNDNDDRDAMDIARRQMQQRKDRGNVKRRKGNGGGQRRRSLLSGQRNRDVYEERKEDSDSD